MTFCFEFCSQLDCPDSYGVHIADFAQVHKAKQMVHVWFHSGKVEFSSQKAIIRPSHQNYQYCGFVNQQGII